MSVVMATKQSRGKKKLQDFLATMCHALRIDYRKEYMTREGCPMTFLTPSARPVQEAF